MKKFKETKERRTKGITLVALVVTIVVLLILAGITISMLFGENGIIAKAQHASEATKNDQDTTENGLKNLAGQMNEALGLKGIKASDIATATNKSAYYGKKVNYTVTNEDVKKALKGQKTLYPEGVTWQLFYADSNNIYLIANDYIPVSTIPQPIGPEPSKTPGTAPEPNNDNYPLSAPLTNVLSSYAGSSRITDTKLKNLNKSYFIDGNYSSENNNMKAVAYMMDTEAWSIFKGTGAEYVIGGPIIEMLMKSYSEYNGLIDADGTYGYSAYASSAIGYKVKWNYGKSENTYIDDSNYRLDHDSDNMYVKKTDTNRALAYWLSSPAASDADHARYVGCDGSVARNSYALSGNGFRPVVALSSEVLLKPVYNTDGELSFDITQ